MTLNELAAEFSRWSQLSNKKPVLNRTNRLFILYLYIISCDDFILTLATTRFGGRRLINRTHERGQVCGMLPPLESESLTDALENKEPLVQNDTTNVGRYSIVSP